MWRTYFIKRIVPTKKHWKSGSKLLTELTGLLFGWITYRLVLVLGCRHVPEKLRYAKELCFRKAQHGLWTVLYTASYDDIRGQGKDDATNNLCISFATVGNIK